MYVLLSTRKITQFSCLLQLSFLSKGEGKVREMHIFAVLLELPNGIFKPVTRCTHPHQLPSPPLNHQLFHFSTTYSTPPFFWYVSLNPNVGPSFNSFELSCM